MKTSKTKTAKTSNVVATLQYIAVGIFMTVAVVILIGL